MLPFVIPFLVSGPDYTFQNNAGRWRRQQRGDELEAPWVSPCQWTAGFARRCESQCRQDWTALPMIRSVNFKHAVETGNTMVTVPVWRKRGSGLKPSAEEYVAMAQKLCEVLWHGHIRYGSIKVPLNGDNTIASRRRSQQNREITCQTYRLPYWPLPWHPTSAAFDGPYALGSTCQLWRLFVLYNTS